MGPDQVEWHVAVPPFYPFVLSMSLPIATQYFYPKLRYPYFNKINEKLHLPQFNNINNTLSWRLLFGSILSYIGFQFISKSLVEMEDDDKRPKLATNGVWRLSRHPIYFGSLLFQFGVSLIADNGITALLTV